ncbi:WD40 repeat [Ostreococcus tauri]|uniref:WD40 repeat n=1 Tax=Ostreococcus tauri TaxID=70448 RepID=A0A096P9T9_OSTTA|nr:WD40 repeat [Ostreococcus tauri]OUS49136.1 WD40 repeat protein [Ostreococcus tauri]CEG01703.1 WD40 repeat [Ostreococcus tauri]|eukprot:XP_022841114.1 WD40 repeat [Ostreococcus tauri]
MATVDASSLRLRELNGIKVYEVSSARAAPEWAKLEKSKRKLRKREDYQRRIELVQDLSFTASSSRVKTSPDGQFLIVSGLHPPQVKCYDVSQLSMKWCRHMDAEIVDFCCLSDDYSKLAFICADRSIRFHAKFGNYYNTRTPKQGRDVCYSENTADLCVVGSSSEVWRLNLEQGRFLQPLESKCDELNVCGISPTHGLFAAGSGDGEVECFDLRARKSCAAIRCVDRDDEGGVTALRFDPNGLQMAVGTEGGYVRLFDLRSSRPLRVKDHMNGFPIVDLKYHTTVDGVRRLVSTDKKIVKIWEEKTGEPYTSIEPGYEINDLCLWDKTGLMMMAQDHTQLSVFFTPSLGAAPKWCSFLENLTEEMEERTQENLYDDYRFITREELEKLHLSHLIGTKMLRAYMHGFFMDNRLYGKAKAIAEPFSYDDFKKKKIKEKLEEERQSRITIKKKAPKVNAVLAARLGAEAEAGDGAEELVDEDGDEVAGEAPGGNLLEDDRFAAMFKDSAYEINEDDETFKMLHPNAPKMSKNARKEMLEDHFELVDDDDDDDIEEDKEPKMYAAKDEFHANAFKDGRVTKADLPLKERAKMEKARETTKRARVTGNREAFFDASAPKSQSMKRLGKARSADEYGEDEGLAAEGAWKEQLSGHSRGSRRGMDGVLGKMDKMNKGGPPRRGGKGKK